MKNYITILHKPLKSLERKGTLMNPTLARAVKRLFLSAMLVSFSWLAKAQCPVFGDIILTRQAEITNFNTIFPGCSQVISGLFISGGDLSDPITDLSPLAVLTKVSGGLSVVSLQNITSLNGLQNITSVGSLEVSDVLQITSLTGLTKLATVTGNMFIAYNPNLETFNGLNAITSISGALNMEQNPKLNDISKLSAITSTQGLAVFRCPSLTSLTGLGGITSISEYFAIVANDNLTSLAGLSSLTSLTGSLGITGNPKIPNLAALHALTTTSGDIYISENTAMTSLNGLENLTTVGGSFELSDNPALTSLSSLSNLTSVGVVFGIYTHPALLNLSGLGNLLSVGSLGISANSLITDLSGLTNLTTISKNFWAISNPLLTSLQGLGKVTSTLEELDIAENPLLTNISALAKIHGVTNYLGIRANSSLANCVVSPVCAFIASSPANSAIGGNTGDCLGLAEVEIACDAALPVELVRFQASREESQAVLQWETASEINSSRFEIERSNSMAKNWTSVATVLSKGESSVRLNYSFRDLNPLNGINLYRLKMVDLDKSFSYSRIVAVKFENGLSEFFPNPASDKVFVRKVSGVQPVQVFNVDGKMVLSGSASEQTPVDVSRLPNGLYLFNISNQKVKIVVHH